MGDAESENEDNYNRLMPREFLKRIPGVNSNNIGRIMSKVKNMVEFVKLEVEELEGLLGSRDGAK